MCALARMHGFVPVCVSLRQCVVFGYVRLQVGECVCAYLRVSACNCGHVRAFATVRACTRRSICKCACVHIRAYVGE